MNTAITYIYRDAANYKAHTTIKVEGIIELKNIQAYLNDNEYFIPDDIGLEELQEQLQSFPDQENDHIWHQISKDSFEPTSEEPDQEFSAKKLIERFKIASQKGWKEAEATKRLNLK